MGNSNNKANMDTYMPNEAAAPILSKKTEEPTKKKPCPACSACQETRKIRDACVFEKGEEHCGDLIEAHKQCLRDHGMKI